MESVLSSACGMIAGVGCIRWDLFPTEVLPRYRWMGGTPWAVKLIAFLAVLLAPSRNADSNLAADPKIHDDEVRFCVFPTHVCILLLDSPCKAVQSFSHRTCAQVDAIAAALSHHTLPCRWLARLRRVG